MENIKDQDIVERFIKDLVGRLVKKFKKDIDFIILYGSAARGEFIIGVSDIDLLIQTTDEDAVQPIKDYSAKIFWELDKKHKTGFHNSCSIAGKNQNLLGRILDKLENECQLYTPLFVFGPEDLDWEKAQIVKKDLLLGANLLVSQSSIFYKFKYEGKMYYGRDIRKVIKPNMTFWERYKGILIPQHFATFAVLLWPFLPYRAVKYCNKAILYEVDSALMYLEELDTNKRRVKHEKLKKASEFDFAIRNMTSIIEFDLNVKYSSLKPKDFKIIEEALEYKKKGFNLGRLSALSYISRCWWFILRMNTAVFFKRLFSRKRF